MKTTKKVTVIMCVHFSFGYFHLQSSFQLLQTVIGTVLNSFLLTNKIIDGILMLVLNFS